MTNIEYMSSFNPSTKVKQIHENKTHLLTCGFTPVSLMRCPHSPLGDHCWGHSPLSASSCRSVRIAAASAPGFSQPTTDHEARTRACPFCPGQDSSNVARDSPSAWSRLSYGCPAVQVLLPSCPHPAGVRTALWALPAPAPASFIFHSCYPQEIPSASHLHFSEDSNWPH